MTTRTARVVAGALLTGILTGCTQMTDHPAPNAAPRIPSVTASPGPGNAAMRDWEALARDHFKESALALQRISEASDAGDESAVRSGCEILHDTNAIGLQHDLPTPDPGLSAELQKMIDDMNSATHACLRFVSERQEQDAANYQEYLARAVDHLQRAKTLLDAALRPG